MLKINLLNPKQSEISYEVTKFPDGEPHIKLGEIDHKEEYQVICRITNPSELFLVMQVGDILNRHGVVWQMLITYLMSQRMDRVMTFNEAFSLELVANWINTLNCHYIEIFEVHSSRAYSLIKNSGPARIGDYMTLEDHRDWCICYPDKGACERYWQSGQYDVIVFNKKRDLSTGKIASIDMVSCPDEDPSKILVIDDLCDAGGTFIGVAQGLRKKYPNAQIEIFVRHMVNPKGIENLSANYDNVYFTNSYRNWTDLPANCHIKNII